MVAAKQPVKPTPATSAAKPTTAISNTSERRPSLPPLSPLPGAALDSTPAATPQPVPATAQTVTSGEGQRARKRSGAGDCGSGNSHQGHRNAYRETRSQNSHTRRHFGCASCWRKNCQGTRLVPNH
jgi:hypothetical protein